LLVVGGVELEGGGGLIDRRAYDEEIRIMSIDVSKQCFRELRRQPLRERSQTAN
jgi:hypothetical protein